MGKDPKNQLRKATRLQIERQLMQLRNQGNRILDLLHTHYEKVEELVASLKSLDQEPGLTDSAAGDTTQRSRHRATSHPPARKKQVPKARK